MTQDFTLHTHTTGFDGRSTVAQMATAAELAGMKTLGISNHFILHPEIKAAAFYPFAVQRGYQNMYSDSMDNILSRFTANYDEIYRVANNTNVNLLRGMEADFFLYPGWRTNFEYAIKILRPDYIIGAVHFVEKDGKLYNMHDIGNAAPDERNQMLKLYWAKVRMAVESGLFNFMAHLDLPRKATSETAAERWIDEELHTIDTMSQYSLPFEINTSATGAPYPSFRIIQAAGCANLPFLLSDDAHEALHIGRDFVAAGHLARILNTRNNISLQKILDFSNKTL